MNIKKYIFEKFLFLFSVLFFVPGMAFASSVYFETAKSTIFAGDTFIISVKIDSEEEDINSVEGSIVLESKNDNFVVNDFSLAQSVFTLWPRTPSLSEDTNIISFAGGVPGGFDDGKATLFNIVVETDKEGAIQISPKDIAIYANDGKGTRVPVKIQNLTIQVSPKNEGIAPVNEWNTLVINDKTNPDKFTIEVGRDSSLFDGKRFAFFTAIDKQSGISYYEVSENDNLPIRSGSMYVLQNQDENITPKLTVTAYDKAGNKTTVSYEKPGFKIFGFSLNFFLLLIVIIIVWFILKRIKRNRNNVQNNQ